MVIIPRGTTGQADFRPAYSGCFFISDWAIDPHPWQVWNGPITGSDIVASQDTPNGWSFNGGEVTIPMTYTGGGMHIVEHTFLANDCGDPMELNARSESWEFEVVCIKIRITKQTVPAD